MPKAKSVLTPVPTRRVTADLEKPGALQFRILDAGVAEGRQAWLDLWQAWPEREVMAHPDYVGLFAGPEDLILAATARTARGGILYPFIARPLGARRTNEAGIRPAPSIQRSAPRVTQSSRDSWELQVCQI
jgi:hypothetical protein